MVGGVEPELSIAASYFRGDCEGYPVPLNVESMFTPGAAIFTAGPKLLKNANVSSGTVALSPLSVRLGPAAPHTPSLS